MKAGGRLGKRGSGRGRVAAWLGVFAAAGLAGLLFYGIGRPEREAGAAADSRPVAPARDGLGEADLYPERSAVGASEGSAGAVAASEPEPAAVMERALEEVEARFAGARVLEQGVGAKGLPSVLIEHAHLRGSTRLDFLALDAAGARVSVYAADHLLVDAATPEAVAQAQAFARARGTRFEAEREGASVGQIWFTVQDMDSPLRVQAELAASGLEHSYNYFRFPSQGPQWPDDVHYPTSGDIEDINYAQTQVLVAVIDDGDDFGQWSWNNPGEIRDNGIDDDGNGYVDDYWGYDVLGNDGTPTSSSYYNNHGEKVREVVRGYYEESPIEIVTIRAANEGMYDNDAIEALEYVEKLKRQGFPMAVANISYGGSGENALFRRAIGDLWDLGVAFTAAAGNESNNNDENPSYPANYTYAISVASASSTGNIYTFSNRGRETVDFAAPGYDGTSFAAPYVAKQIAHMKSAYPGEPIPDIIQILRNTARRIGNAEELTQYGLIDGYAAAVSVDVPLRYIGNGPIVVDRYDSYTHSNNLNARLNIVGNGPIAISGTFSDGTRVSQRGVQLSEKFESPDRNQETLVLTISDADESIEAHIPIQYRWRLSDAARQRILNWSFSMDDMEALTSPGYSWGPQDLKWEYMGEKNGSGNEGVEYGPGYYQLFVENPEPFEDELVATALFDIPHTPEGFRDTVGWHFVSQYSNLELPRLYEGQTGYLDGVEVSGGEPIAYTGYGMVKVFWREAIDAYGLHRIASPDIYYSSQDSADSFTQIELPTNYPYFQILSYDENMGSRILSFNLDGNFTVIYEDGSTWSGSANAPLGKTYPDYGNFAYIDDRQYFSGKPVNILDTDGQILLTYPNSSISYRHSMLFEYDAAAMTPLRTIFNDYGVLKTQELSLSGSPQPQPLANASQYDINGITRSGASVLAYGDAPGADRADAYYLIDSDSLVPSTTESADAVYDNSNKTIWRWGEPVGVVPAVYTSSYCFYDEGKLLSYSYMNSTLSYRVQDMVEPEYVLFSQPQDRRVNASGDVQLRLAVAEDWEVTWYVGRRGDTREVVGETNPYYWEDVPQERLICWARATKGDVVIDSQEFFVSGHLPSINWAAHQNELLEVTEFGPPVWRSSWLGYFDAQRVPWVYSYYGWWWVDERLLARTYDGYEGTWFYHAKYGWIWTGSELFPYAWDGDGDWLYFERRRDGARVYDFGARRWEDL